MTDEDALSCCFLSLTPPLSLIPSYLRVVLCHQLTKPAHPSTPLHLSTPIPAGLKAVCFLFSVLYTFHVMRKLNSFRYRTMITFGPIAASPKICCHATDAASAAAAAVLQRERVWVVALLGLPYLPNIACDLRMLWRKLFSLPFYLSISLSLSRCLSVSLALVINLQKFFFMPKPVQGLVAS